MFKNVTPMKAIAFTRFVTVLSCCWPPSSAATKSQVLLFKIMRFAMFINASALLLALAYAAYLHYDDSIIIAKAGCISFSLIHVIVQMFYFIDQYDNFQRLIKEMVVSAQDAEPAEMCVFQSYVDRFSTFYTLAVSWFYMSLGAVVMGTLLLPQPFPTNAEYPFSVDYEPIRSIIFVHQTLAGTQCAAHTCVNVFGALLISFAAARIEILALELRDVVNAGDLTECIKKYYRDRRYAQDVAKAVQFIALMTVTISGLAILLGGIAIVGKQPLAVKTQFIALGVTGLLEVFMCAWPADNLMHVVSFIRYLMLQIGNCLCCCQSQNIRQGAYESMWYERSVKMQKLTLCTMLPQEAVAVSIKCVMPTLSLRYFCTYVSNVFSFFTALRVMMTDAD